jgi:hypothetical protein
MAFCHDENILSARLGNKRRRLFGVREGIPQLDMIRVNPTWDGLNKKIQYVATRDQVLDGFQIKETRQVKIFLSWPLNIR